MPSSEAGSAYKRQDNKVDNADEKADGPQPMRDCRPSKTTPNSADHFRQTHEAEYEARGKRSGDAVQRAQRHNAAPALRDELDRRRSTARVTAARRRRVMNAESICSMCRKLNRRRARRTIQKTRGHGRRRQYRTRERQYRSRKREVNRRKIPHDKFVRVDNPEGSVSGNGSSASDVRSLKSPSTAEPSVSSYNTYPSMDHEPMV